MTKKFDAVSFMREARERSARELHGKSFAEQRRILDEAIKRFGFSPRDAMRVAREK